MAGAGNDRVSIENIGLATNYIIDLGAGNDQLNIRYYTQPFTVTLGAGMDTIIFDADAREIYRPGVASIQPIVVTDFEAGDGGDIINFDAIDLLNGYNPILHRTIAIRQDGNDVIIVLRKGARDFDQVPILRLQNTLLSQLTAHNFGGLDPFDTSQSPLNLDTNAVTEPILVGASTHIDLNYLVNLGYRSSAVRISGMSNERVDFNGDITAIAESAEASAILFYNTGSEQLYLGRTAHISITSNAAYTNPYEPYIISGVMDWGGGVSLVSSAVIDVNAVS